MPGVTSEPSPGVPRFASWKRESWIWLTSLVLVICLSGWVFWSLRREGRRADEAHFSSLIQQAKSDISQHMAIYENALRGGQALFSLSPSITRARWKFYVGTLNLAERYPGVRGLGVVFVVDPEKLESFLAGVRAEGRPDFSLKDSFPSEANVPNRGRGGPFYIITYREPETSVDLAAIGVNIAEEANRREAVEMARDRGEPTVTRQLYLTVDSAKRPAFILYAPIFQTDMPITTVEERRLAIRGWLYASFITENLVGAAMGRGNQEVELSFFEGDSPSAKNMLYASGDKQSSHESFERWDKLQLAGRTFSLGWNRSSHFVSSGKVNVVRTGAASAVAAVLLAALVASLFSSRNRDRETIALQDAELALQKFALDQHAIVAITDATGTITYANDKFCAISGHTREELVGQNHRLIKSGIHPPEFFRQMYATITNGKVWQGEICNRTKQGGLYWMSATIVPVAGPDGRPKKYVAIRTDITERKRSEERVAERERLIRAVTDGLPGLIAYWTADLHCTFSNRAYIEWFGRDPKSMLGMRMVDLLGEELFRLNEPYIQGALKGQVQSFDRTLTKANGDIGYTWAQYVPDFGADGTTVKGFFVLVSDVTEAKIKSDALREAAQRLQLAAAITQIGVWEWNLADNRVQADERMFEIHGLQRTPDGYFPFDVWRTLVLPEDLPTQMAHLSHTIASRGRSRRQFRIHRLSDGALRYIESEEQVQTNDAGKAVRVIGVNRDITDMVQAESALMESEARTRLFAEHAPASVAMFDREMRYLVVSKQWMADYKLTDKSIIGQSHYDVFPAIPDRWKEIHRRCLEGAVETALSDQFTLTDGSIQWLQWEVRPWHTPNGKIGGIVMFTLDITQRIELEARLEKARDDALAASRLKSEFLATMSHEIRTPMNGVIGMANLLLQTPLDSRQHEMGQALVNSAERLLVIINDILDFSKIEAGKLRIEPVDFNLRDVIEETTALMAAPAHRKDLHFTCDIDPALATGFKGDSGRIQQVLANLLGNAVKFTQHGEIAVSAAGLHVLDSEASFRIKVSDTGIGIPASAREHLFQPFVQADGSTTRRFGGTGLGLAICSQLVGLMGGRIGFESTEGTGSTFWFELCLPRVALPAIESSDQIPPEARVLVVDDHEVNRQILLRQLAALNIDAEAATSATEALAVLGRAADGAQPFNIALLDWNMPHMDGLALAHAIRANPRIASTCLIVLSSTHEAIEPSVAAELKFHAVLTKPVRDAQLQRCLLRVYGRRVTPSPFPVSQTLAGRGLKLLLAEDNETNQLVAQLTLEQMGHSVEIAENGRAALEWLAAEPFDAVLMDCQMPEMDGYEAARQIRMGKVHGANPNIPIIALTAYAMPADRTRSIEAGMDDYVSKPLSAESLRAALSRCGLVKSRSEIVAEIPAAAAAAKAKKPTFDPAQRQKLLAIATPAGGTLWGKALGIFMEKMPERLAALASHAAGRRSHELATVAHTLAGSAAAIGAPALHAAGLALEATAQENDWARVPVLLEAIQDEWKYLKPKLIETANS